MSTLAEAQAKVTHTRSELARLAAELQKLSEAEGEVARIQGELDALTASSDKAAAEWAAAIIDGTPAASGPPMPPAAGAGDILRERLSEAKSRADVVRAARVPIQAKRDELLHELRLGEEAVEKRIHWAMQAEGRRVYREMEAALTVAGELADSFRALISIVGDAASALPSLPYAVDHVSTSRARVDVAKDRWRILRSIIEQHDPEATLETVTAFEEYEASKRKRAAAAE